MDGWSSVEKCNALAKIIVEAKPETIVLIGVYAGRDLCAMALACKENKKGIVIGVDPWEASESVKGQNSEHSAWWGQCDHDGIHKKCVNSVMDWKVENHVRLIRSTSDNFTPPDKIDILSIDGNHGVQVLNDTMKFAPKVVKGGFIVCDDLSWDGGNVETSIKILFGLGFTWHSKVKNDVDDYAILKKTY